MKGTPSIESMTLKVYLDNSAAIHNGNRYSNFVWLMNLPKNKKIPISNVAVLFNVSRNTAVKWAKIYRKELKNEKTIN